MKRYVLAVCAMLVLAGSVAHAFNFGRVSIISSTLGNVPNRLCAGAYTSTAQADIGCPSYSPYLTSGGLLGVGTSSPTATLQVSGSFIVSTSTAPTSPSLYVGTDGKVGIGTTAPGALLEVNNSGQYLRVVPGAETQLNASNALKFNSSSYLGASANGAIYLDKNTDFQIRTYSGSPQVEVTASGNVGIGTTNPNAKLEVSGTVSATHFVGDGSGLTGVTAASSDRITSGTTQMVVVSSTGFVSLTQASTNTGWFDPTRGLVTLGVSATGPISGTGGYFSGNVGIGTTAPATALDVSGYVTIRNGAGVGSYGVNGAGTLLLNSTNGNGVNVYGELAPSSDGGGLGDATHRWNGNFTSGIFSSNVGIGTTSPGATLDINGGTVTASSPALNVSQIWNNAATVFSGAVINVTPTAAQGTSKILDVQAAGTTQAGVTRYGVLFGGAVQQGTNPATPNVKLYNGIQVGGSYPIVWEAGSATGGEVGTAVDTGLSRGAAGKIYVGNGTASDYTGTLIAGNVGIGTTDPSKTLHVSGTVLTTSWTGINFSSTGNVTPTAPLEVSGTISATHFVGDGSGLTNLSVQGDRIISGTSKVTVNSATSTISFTTNGSVANYVDASGRFVMTGISTTSNQASFTTINLASTPTGTTVGLIYKNGLPFISTYAASNTTGLNTFIGENAGNLTMAKSVGAYEASYNTAVGNGAFSANTTGYENTAVGTSALLNNTTGYENTAIGHSTLQTNSQGYENTAVGRIALYTNSSGYDNTATGFGALYTNGTGYWNTANGVNSLYYNSSGYNNVAVGIQALLNNTTGNTNSAVGVAALRGNTTGTNNAAIGANSLYYNTLGSRNVADGVEAGYGVNGATIVTDTVLLGYRAGYGLTTSQQNTLLGAKAGYGLTTGSINIIIGYNVDAPSNTTSNWLNIGNIVSGSMQTTGTLGFGGSVTVAGNVGIGTLTPTTALEVSGTISATHVVGDGSELTNLAVSSDRITSGTSNVTVNSTTSTISFTTNGSVANYVDGSGRFVMTGISTTSNQASFTTINLANSPAGDKSGGIIYKNGYPFISTYAATGTAGYNLFIGKGAGNTTLTGSTYWESSFNVALGNYTLISNTTGNYNIATGHQALYNNTTGNDNIANGYQALYNNTTGFDNIAIGQSALNANVSGTGNIALGSMALNHNTGGSNNIANGSYAIFSNSMGDGNVANGYYALFSNTTGSYNIANGYYPMDSNITGSNNIANGAWALYSNTSGNNNIANGYQALNHNTTADNNIATGYQALYSNTTGGNNIASGYMALEHNTTGWYNSANGDMALYSNTTGSSNIANGSNALEHNTTGWYNVANGVYALYSNTTGDYNVANGYQSLFSNTTGNYNVASGDSALYSNTTGHDNIASGQSALYSNSTGNYNIAGGDSALYSNTTGWFNIAIGDGALYSNTTASYNIALGSNALFSTTTGGGNIATGVLALSNNTTGSQNIASGYNALQNLQAGSYNVAVGSSAGYGVSGSTIITSTVLIGNSAGYNLTTSQKNVIVGASAGSGLTTGSSNILVGAGVTTPSNTTSNWLNIGNIISGTMQTTGTLGFGGSVTVAGNVGIGTLTPTTALEVSGTVSATHFAGDGSGLTGIGGGGGDAITSGTTKVTVNSATSTISFTTNGSVANYIDSSGRLVTTGISVTSNQLSATTGYFSGNVGIGTTSPTQKLYVSNGNIGLDDGYYLYGGGNAIAGVAGGNAVFGNGNSTSLRAGGAIQLYLSPNSGVDIGLGAAFAGGWVTPPANGLIVQGNVGIGTNNPSKTLHVSGTVLTTSWTGINFSSTGNVTPTAPLEVSGTISATHFVGDGSGLTGVGGSSDRITSGTSNITVNSATSTISFTTNGSVGNYIDSSGRLVTTGISVTTNQLSATTAYFSGNVGIGTTAPSSSLHVATGGLLAVTGTFGGGTAIPSDLTGAGTVMYFYPKKAAFRAGYVSDNSTWDDGHIGDYSVAMGKDTVANGVASMAVGDGATASGEDSFATGTNTGAANWASFAMGWATLAQGEMSLALNDQTDAQGDASVAAGDGSITRGFASMALGFAAEANGYSSMASNYSAKANGDGSAAMGVYTIADSFSDMAIGQYNVGGGDGGEWVATDPIFEIGIGTADDARANAMTVLKNGNVGIGLTSPTTALEISGTISATHFVGDGSGLTGIGGGSGDAITSGTTKVTVNSATSTISFTTNGSVANYVDGSGRLVMTGISTTTNQLSATTGYFSGKVGFGTTSPAARLQINAANDTDALTLQNSSLGGTAAWDWFLHTNGNNTDLRLYEYRPDGNSGNRVTFLSNGNVGIGSTNPTTTLEISGTVSATAAAFNSVGIGAAASATNVLYVSGTAYITSSTNAYAFLYTSDKRLKTDITPLKDATSRLMQVQPVNFRYLRDGRDGRVHIGFIAQDMEQVYPEAVYTDTSGMKQIDYPALVAPLWQAIREEKSENDTLRANVKALEQRVEQIERNQARIH